MSAVSTRAAVPRPSARKSAAPPSTSPRSRRVPPCSPGALPKKFQGAKATVRDTLPTLDLTDDDVVDVERVAVPSSPAAPERSAPAAPPNLPSVEQSSSRSAVASPAPLARFESVLDPAEVLFERMYELELVDTLWQAASVCAVALGRALGARAVLVHAHDSERRELRMIGVYGNDTTEIVGSLAGSDDDLVGSAVICNEKAVTMRFQGELSRLAPHRFKILGAPQVLVAVPVMARARCLAIIEILDAENRFADRVADSAAYVANRLAASAAARF